MRRMLNTLFVLTEDAYLSLENNNVVVQTQDRTLGKIPLLSIEQILCFSYKGASPALMGACAQNGVALSFYSPHGKYYCSIFGEENRNVLLRRQQYRLAESDTVSRDIAASIVIGKIYNSRWVLDRTKRDHPMVVNVERIDHQCKLLVEDLDRIKGCKTVDEVRGVEGMAAKDYFFAFDDMILRDKDSFYFEKRSRRPPRDRMNALLSFIYVLVASDCAAALQGVGLDPYVGYLHTDRPGKPSLALELVEEMRAVIADRFAMSLVNLSEIKASDFEEHEDGGVFLSEAGRKSVLSQWQKHKTQEITHPYLQEKIPWGLVPYAQALLFARYVRGDIDAYPPFMWK